MVAAASTTIPVTNAATHEYIKISLSTLAIANPPVWLRLTRAALGHCSTVAKRWNVFGSRALNVRKNPPPLRPHSKRPRRRSAAEERDELAPLHVGHGAVFDFACPRRLRLTQRRRSRSARARWDAGTK